MEHGAGGARCAGGVRVQVTPGAYAGAGRARAGACGVLAALGDMYRAIGNKAMAKAVWRQALAILERALGILEELHDPGAEEVRSRLGAKPGPRCPACAEFLPP